MPLLEQACINETSFSYSIPYTASLIHHSILLTGIQLAGPRTSYSITHCPQQFNLHAEFRVQGTFRGPKLLERSIDHMSENFFLISCCYVDNALCMPEMHQILVSLDVNMARHVCQHLVRRLVPHLNPRLQLLPSLLHPMIFGGMHQGTRGSGALKPGIVEILSEGSEVPVEHQPKLVVVLQLEHFGSAGLLQGAPKLQGGGVLPCRNHRVLKLGGSGDRGGVQDAVIVHADLLLAGEVEVTVVVAQCGRELPCWEVPRFGAREELAVWV